jgi:3-vinyl bacteriochlorophyllide hydratase
MRHQSNPRVQLYTAEQRQRRNRSPWTAVQGVLAPLQFLAFAISLVLVLRCLHNGTGVAAANLSVLVKTGFLYAIMVTGSLWERDVYGEWLFAAPFFWEDLVSMLVIALHTAYVVALFMHWLPAPKLMVLALAAYFTYVVNAGQFLLKFRAARLGTQRVAPRVSLQRAGAVK